MERTSHWTPPSVSDYERLLKESQRGPGGLERAQRGSVSRFGLQGKSIGDELQKLQAVYATAYRRLEQHGKICILLPIHDWSGGSLIPPASVFISPRRRASRVIQAVAGKVVSSVGGAALPREGGRRGEGFQNARPKLRRANPLLFFAAEPSGVPCLDCTERHRAPADSSCFTNSTNETANFGKGQSAGVRPH